MSDSPTRPQPYIRGDRPVLDGNDMVFLVGELRRISLTMRDLVDLCPQEANSAPARLRKSMIRFSMDPWWPVSGQTADAWVYFDGTAWQYL